MELRVRNVNQAISEMLWVFKSANLSVSQSRNGPVLAYLEPVMTVYDRPQERVLFWGERDANPVFHLMESIWMLAGRRDVAFLQQFNSKIGLYSDDGEVFNAAYGYRWREHFGYDQLTMIIEILKKDPNTRQAVIQMWEPGDLAKITKDKACNTQVFFEIRQGELNMTVINRSNDLWYGAYGANVVHFSMMMEFVASAVGVKMGFYRQFSHNLHLYTELYDAKKHLDFPPNSVDYDAYAQGVKPFPIMMPGEDYNRWLEEAERFCEDPFTYPSSSSTFFRNVAYPMARVSHSRKNGLGDGMKWADKIIADDWRIATQDWIERREEAKKRK